MSGIHEQPAPRRWERNPVVWLPAALVLAVLCFLALNAALRARERASRCTCLSNLSQLAKAMRLYAEDYNGYLFYGNAEVFSRPPVRGEHGQTQYLKDVMKKYGVRSESTWHCPSDRYATRDFSSDPAWSGTFRYRKAGVGYAAIPHLSDSDPGIRALHSRLLLDCGADTMRVDHRDTSYRFVQAQPADYFGFKPPAQIHNIQRVYRFDWGAYGYWDINPGNADLFEEDLPFHFADSRGPRRCRIFGKIYAFRDGHAEFRTHESPGFNNYGELINYY